MNGLSILFLFVVAMASFLLILRAGWFFLTAHSLTVSGGRIVLKNRVGKVLVESNIADISRPDWKYERQSNTSGSNFVVDWVKTAWGITQHEGPALALGPARRWLRLRQFGTVEDIVGALLPHNPTNVPRAAVKLTLAKGADMLFGSTAYGLVFAEGQPKLLPEAVEGAAVVVRVDDSGRVLLTRLSEERITVDRKKDVPLGEEVVVQSRIVVGGEKLSVERLCPERTGPDGAPTSRTRLGRGKAKVALVCGIVAVVAWIVPIAGTAIAATGLLLVRLGPKTGRTKLARTATALNAVGLVLSIWNGALAALLKLLR